MATTSLVPRGPLADEPGIPTDPPGGDDSQGGFTIVEMMVALSLMAVAMVAISGVFFTGLKAASASSARTSAVALATRDTEAIRAVPYDDMGFYDNQTGRVATFEARATVSLGAAPSVGVTPRLQPVGSEVVGPLDYAIRRHISWVGAVGPSAASFSEAYKKTVVIVTWTDGSGAHEVRQDSVVYPGGLGTYVGPGSSGTTTTTAGVLTAPSAPTLVGATAAAAPQGQTQLNVAWTAPTSGGAVAHYIVQWANNAGFTSGVASSQSQPGTATSYQATGLAPGLTYHFRLYAYASDVLVSPSSNIVSGATLPGSATTCTVTNLNVTGTGNGANKGLGTKTYLKQDGTLSESLALVVTSTGTCSSAFSVRAVSPTGTLDPGSAFATTGGGGTATGSVPENSWAWSVGVHTFTVLRDGTAVSPPVEKTFLVCAKTNSESASANAC